MLHMGHSRMLLCSAGQVWVQMLPVASMYGACLQWFSPDGGCLCQGSICRQLSTKAGVTHPPMTMCLCNSLSHRNCVGCRSGPTPVRWATA